MIDSLDMLTSRRKALHQDIQKSEHKLSNTWNALFHEKDNDTYSSFSPTQKALKFISQSSVVIDGLLLGWKLYHRFGRGLRRH